MREIEPHQEAQHVPAQNIEVEQGFLGGLLTGLDQTAILRVLDLISPEAFYAQGHQTIYRTMIALHQRGMAVDLMTVVNALQDSGQIVQVGGPRYVRSLLDFSLNTINIDSYANLITEKYQHRRVNEILRNALEDVSDPSTPIAAVLSRAGDAFSQLAAIEKAPITSINTAMANAYAALVDRFESDKPIGNLTGLYDLDSYTGGFQPKTLGFLAARPSMGKTSLALEMARGCAAKGASVLFFSIEMPTDDLCDRMMSCEAEVDSLRLKTAKALSTKEWQKLGQAVGTIGQQRIWFDDSSEIGVDQVISRTKLWMAKEGVDPRRCVIFVDHLNLIASGNDRDSGHVATTKNTKKLKSLAKTTGCSVVCLLQLNRGTEDRQNKRPTMADGRESGSIEENADYFFGLYRDDYYNPESENRNITELIILKHRNGPKGTIRLLFVPEFTKFMSLSQPGHDS